MLHQRTGSALPNIAIFPAVYVPTSRRRFGNARASVMLPVWGQKDIGEWSIFGGGGYIINPGWGRRNFWLQGLAVSRNLAGRFSLGVEVFHHGRHVDVDDALAFTAVTLGASCQLSHHCSVLSSGGPGFQNARAEGRFSFYAALTADF